MNGAHTDTDPMPDASRHALGRSWTGPTAPRLLGRIAFVIALIAVTAACEEEVTGPEDPPPAPAPAEVVVSPGEAEVHSLGQSVEFSATVLDDDGQEMSGVDLEWSSSDTGVLEPQDGSVFVSVANGTAEVTATVADDGGSLSGSATVLVQQVPAEVEVAPSAATLWAIGQSLAFESVVRDAEGVDLLEEPEVAWSVDGGEEPSVSVSESGMVTALTDGESEVSATAGEVSGEATVDVRATLSVAACLSELSDDPDQDAHCSVASVTAHTPAP